jgi:hypothetical protein
MLATQSWAVCSLCWPQGWVATTTGPIRRAVVAYVLLDFLGPARHSFL